jgi:hypothetical protein
MVRRHDAETISEGFNLGFCRAKPGNGPVMHNHDTNEMFIPMTGTWRCSWENESGEVEFVDVGPYDGCPSRLAWPGVSRMCKRRSGRRVDAESSGPWKAT